MDEMGAFFAFVFSLLGLILLVWILVTAIEVKTKLDSVEACLIEQHEP